MKIKVSKQVKIYLCNGLETYNGKVAKVLPKNDNLYVFPLFSLLHHSDNNVLLKHFLFDTGN